MLLQDTSAMKLVISATNFRHNNRFFTLHPSLRLRQNELGVSHYRPGRDFACSMSSTRDDGNTVSTQKPKKMDLEKLIQSQGFGTKKECRSLIQDGFVTILGETITDPKHPIMAQDGLIFAVADEEWSFREKAYVILHKPTGYECSHRPTSHPSVFELLPPQLQVLYRPSQPRIKQAAAVVPPACSLLAFPLPRKSSIDPGVLCVSYE
jgi:hypothetical protein